MLRELAFILLQAFVFGAAGFILFVFVKKFFKASDSE